MEVKTGITLDTADHVNMTTREDTKYHTQLVQLRHLLVKKDSELETVKEREKECRNSLNVLLKENRKLKKRLKTIEKGSGVGDADTNDDDLEGLHQPPMQMVRPFLRRREQHSTEAALLRSEEKKEFEALKTMSGKMVAEKVRFFDCNAVTKVNQAAASSSCQVRRRLWQQEVRKAEHSDSVDAGREIRREANSISELQKEKELLVQRLKATHEKAVKAERSLVEHEEMLRKEKEMTSYLGDTCCNCLKLCMRLRDTLSNNPESVDQHLIDIQNTIKVLLEIEKKILNNRQQTSNASTKSCEYLYINSRASDTLSSKSSTFDYPKLPQHRGIRLASNPENRECDPGTDCRNVFSKDSLIQGLQKKFTMEPSSQTSELKGKKSASIIEGNQVENNGRIGKSQLLQSIQSKKSDTHVLGVKVNNPSGDVVDFLRNNKDVESFAPKLLHEITPKNVTYSERENEYNRNKEELQELKVALKEKCEQVNLLEVKNCRQAKQIDDLHSNLKHKESEVQMLAEEAKNDATNEATKLQALEKELNVALKEKCEQINLLEVQNCRQAKQIEELHSNLKHKESEVQMLAEEAKNEATNEAARLQALQKELNVALKEKCEQVNLLEVQNCRQAMQIEELYSNLKHKESEVQMLAKEAKNEEENEAASLQALQKELKVALEEKCEQVNLLEVQNCIQAKQIEDLHSNLKHKESEVQILAEEAMNEATNEAARLQALEKELNVALKEKCEQIHLLEVNNCRQAKQIEELHSTLKHKECEVEMLAKKANTEATNEAARLQALQIEIQSKESENKKLHHELSVRSAEIGKMNKNLELKDAEIEQLNTNLEDTKSALQLLKEDLLRCESENKVVRTCNENLESKVVEKDSEIERLKLNIKKLNEKLDLKVKNINELSVSISKYDMQLKSLVCQLENKEVEELKLKWKEINTEAESFGKFLEEKNSTIEILHQKTKDQESDIDVLSKKASSNDTASFTFENKETVLEENSSTKHMDEILEDKTQNVVKLRQILSEKDSVIATLKNKVECNLKEIEKLNHHITNQREICLKEKIEEKESEIQILRTEVGQKESAIEVLKNEAKQIDREMDRVLDSIKEKTGCGISQEKLEDVSGALLGESLNLKYCNKEENDASNLNKVSTEANHAHNNICKRKLSQYNTCVIHDALFSDKLDFQQIQSEIEGKHSEIEQLEIEIKNKRYEIEVFQVEIESKDSEIQWLQVEIESKNHEIRQLHNIMDGNFESENVHDYCDEDSPNQTKQEEVSAVNQQVDGNVIDLKRIETSLQNKEEQANKLLKIAELKTNELTKLRHETGEKKNKLDALKIAIQENDIKNKALKNEMKKFFTEETQLQNKAEDKSQELQSMQYQIFMRNSEIQDLEVRIDQESAEIEDLVSQNESLEAEITQLEILLHEKIVGNKRLDEMISSKDLEVSVLRRTVDERNSEIDRNVEISLQKENQIVSLTNEIDCKYSEIQKHLSAIEDKHSEVQKLKEIMDDNISANAAINEEIKTKDIIIEDLKADIEKQALELHLLETEIERKSRAFEELGVEIKRKENERLQLESVLGNKHTEEEELMKKTVILCDENKELNKDLQNRILKISRLHSVLGDMDLQIKTLKESINSKNSEVEERQSKLQDCESKITEQKSAIVSGSWKLDEIRNLMSNFEMKIKILRLRLECANGHVEELQEEVQYGTNEIESLISMLSINEPDLFLYKSQEESSTINECESINGQIISDSQTNDFEVPLEPVIENEVNCIIKEIYACGSDICKDDDDHLENKETLQPHHDQEKHPDISGISEDSKHILVQECNVSEKLQFPDAHVISSQVQPNKTDGNNAICESDVAENRSSISYDSKVVDFSAEASLSPMSQSGENLSLLLANNKDSEIKMQEPTHENQMLHTSPGEGNEYISIIETERESCENKYDMLKEIEDSEALKMKINLDDLPLNTVPCDVESEETHVTSSCEGSQPSYVSERPSGHQTVVDDPISASDEDSYMDTKGKFNAINSDATKKDMSLDVSIADPKMLLEEKKNTDSGKSQSEYEEDQSFRDSYVDVTSPEEFGTAETESPVETSSQGKASCEEETSAPSAGSTPRSTKDKTLAFAEARKKDLKSSGATFSLREPSSSKTSEDGYDEEAPLEGALALPKKRGRRRRGAGWRKHRAVATGQEIRIHSSQSTSKVDDVVKTLDLKNVLDVRPVEPIHITGYGYNDFIKMFQILYLDESEQSPTTSARNKVGGKHWFVIVKSPLDKEQPISCDICSEIIWKKGLTCPIWQCLRCGIKIHKLHFQAADMPPCKIPPEAKQQLFKAQTVEEKNNWIDELLRRSRKLRQENSRKTITTSRLEKMFVATVVIIFLGILLAFLLSNHNLLETTAT